MRFGKPLTLISSLILSGAAYANQWGWNMPKGVTPVSESIYHLHMLIVAIVSLIGIGVFGVMFYSLIKYRKSKGAKAAHFHDHLGVEIIWTIIPALILIGMAIPTTKVLMSMNDASLPDVNIKITGYQWKWRYDYLDENVTFFSNLATPEDEILNKKPKNRWYLLEVDEPLVLPVNKKIRFLLTSNDVNHSWWVPELGIKKDTIPGLITETWARIEKPGVYRGQCTELCGMRHGYMPIVVIALPQQAYEEWLTKRKAGIKTFPAIDRIVKQEDGPTNPARMQLSGNSQKKKHKAMNTETPNKAVMQKGEVVYNRLCAACHQKNGQGMQPTFPAIVGSKVVTGPVKAHIKLILNGSENRLMQAFRDQLNDEDIAAVITYQRNIWGNNDSTYGPHAGGVVRPKDVATLRDLKS